ncbi:MAG: choice-of-anchor I family protein [Vulcanococcus sp.]
MTGLGSFAAVANATAFPGPPAPAPLSPLLGSINLSPDQTKLSTEQLQTEISTTVSLGGAMYVISSGGGSTLQVTNATNAAAMSLVGRTALGAYSTQSATSYGNLLAVALSPSDYSTNGGKGLVRFYRVEPSGSLTQLADVTVGYLPDSIAFNANGTKLVIANEGEPVSGYGTDPSKDPAGSIGIIDIQGRVNLQFSYTELGFAGLALPQGLRVSGPVGTTQATDLEPEYVTVLGNYAYVTLQENNGVAKVNLVGNMVESIFALGTVDYSSQLVDLSDKDGGFRPLLGQAYEGLRMPDGIAAYSVRGQDYVVTANEGDGRDYPAYKDESANPPTSPNVRTLTDDAVLGSPDRLTTFGGRSISVFDADTGALLWDSGNTLQTVAIAAGFYADGRSDSKGVEPEGVVVAQLNGRSYAIVSLERTSSSMLVVFDITDPTAGQFVTSTVMPGSISPEGLHLVEAKHSPTRRTQLVVSNEVSNSLNIFDLEALVTAPPLAGAGSFKSTMIKDVVGGPELSISSLITNGEFTLGLNAADPVFAPTGIFDGQGAYDNGDGTYTLLVNSELGSTSGYGYTLPGVAGALTGARISSLRIDKDADNDTSNGFQSAVVAGGLAYDSIYLDGLDTPIDQVTDLGAAGFKRFCSANLVEANSFGSGLGFADRLYLVGEEEFSGDGGSFFALDVNGRAIHEVVGFGKGTWESATIIDTGNPDTVAVLLFDDAKAPLYLWVGSKSDAPDANFLERNGLAASQGTLYTFVPTALAEDGVSPGADSSDLFTFTKANGLNQGLNGRWVDLSSLNPNYAQLGAPALRQLAVGAGALQLSRIEDGQVNPLNSRQALFVSTGTQDFNKGDLYGNVYTLDFSSVFGANGLLNASGDSVLKVVYDGDLLIDPTAGVRNPDNLTFSADGFVYLQEDRANGGGTSISAGQFGTQEASIWKLAIDPLTGNSVGDPSRWIQIDRSAAPAIYGQTQPTFTNADSNGIGNWESSGIIDVSALYGAAPGSYFLANVQAHSLSNGNLWGSPYLVEGGQINLIHQPF